jgi:hypothetical protein
MGLFNRGKKQAEADRAETSEAAPVRPVLNTRVRESLEEWAQRKDAQRFADVLRRSLSGELLLDITDSRFADVQAGPQRGDTLAITSQRDNAGKNLLVAFTGNDELARYRGRPGISLGQPAAAVLAQAASDYEGIVIDGRSPGAFIAYAEEIRTQCAGDPVAVGRLGELTTERSVPFDEYLEALSAASLFIPLVSQRDEAGTEIGVQLVGIPGPDGSSFAAAGTAPAEIWAWGAALEAQRTGLENIARAVVADGRAGLVVNPAGPSVTIPVDALRRFATPPAARSDGS